MSDTPKMFDSIPNPLFNWQAVAESLYARGRQLERENNRLCAYVSALEEQCDSIGLQKAQHAAGLAKAQPEISP